MVELNVSRWLLIAGILVTTTPWLIHWSYGFFESRPDWHMYYFTAYIAAITASLIAFFGSIIQFSRQKESVTNQTELALALGTGMSGIGSVGIVFLLGMM